MLRLVIIFLLSFNLWAQRPAGNSPGGVKIIGDMTGLASTASTGSTTNGGLQLCGINDRPIHPITVPGNNPTAVICRKMVKVWNPLTIKETNPKKRKYLFLYKEYYWNMPQESVNKLYTNNKTYQFEGKFTGGWKRHDSTGDIQDIAASSPNAQICVDGINQFQTNLNNFTASSNGLPPNPVNSFINQSGKTACRFSFQGGAQAFPFPYWMSDTAFNTIPTTGAGNCTGGLANLRMQTTVNGVTGKAVQLAVAGVGTPDPSCASSRTFSCYDPSGQNATSTQTLTYAQINAGLTLSCGTGIYSFSSSTPNCGGFSVGTIVAGFTKAPRAPDTIANCPTEVPTCAEAMLVAMKDKKERVSNGEQDYDLQFYHDAGLSAPNAKGLTANIPVLPASANWNCQP